MLDDRVTVCLVGIAPAPAFGCYAIDSRGRLWHGRWILKGGTNNEWDWVRLPVPAPEPEPRQ